MKRRSTMALALALALLLAACGAPPAPAAETGAAPAQTAATTPEPVSDWQSEGRAYKQSPVNTGAAAAQHRRTTSSADASSGVSSTDHRFMTAPIRKVPNSVPKPISRRRRASTSRSMAPWMT